MATEVFTYGGISVEISHLYVTPFTYWGTRQQRFQDFLKAKEVFVNMDLDNREIIVNQVKKAIEEMYDEVDKWLPDSFTVFEPGNMIKLEYNLLVLDIDRETSDGKNAVSIKAKNARKEIMDELADEA